MKPWVAIPLAPMGFALIDRRDMLRTVRHRWRRVGGVPMARIGKRDVRLARFIMHPSSGARVLNRTHQPLDCRRENLCVSSKRGRAA